jgi:hypothetical protein
MSHTAKVISSLLNAPVLSSDHRLKTVMSLEPEFNIVCKRNLLPPYADDISEYLVDADGRCRADLSAGEFALRFATSDSDAEVVVEYVKAFFAFFP